MTIRLKWAGNREAQRQADSAFKKCKNKRKKPTASQIKKWNKAKKHKRKKSSAQPSKYPQLLMDRNVPEIDPITQQFLDIMSNSNPKEE